MRPQVRIADVFISLAVDFSWWSLSSSTTAVLDHMNCARFWRHFAHTVTSSTSDYRSFACVAFCIPTRAIANWGLWAAPYYECLCVCHGPRPHPFLISHARC
ncbi:hypothetical protein C8F01DRAFT_647185 [Mycena amicta]|nr:hypothetical protein C8F01DRAFT_647185 [Mycena amicta]